jgi:hypothetical protein
MIMACPQAYGLVDSHICVDPVIIEELRSRLPPREDVFRWVSNDFNVMAQAAYEQIGRPSLGADTLLESWQIYGQMMAVIMGMLA